MYLSNKTIKYILIILLVLILLVLSFLEPIAQDPSYHHFADQRRWAWIPNFWNVVSNLGFLLVGCLGLYRLHRTQKLVIITAIKRNYSVFFLGVALVAFGSAYYHWTPTNQTLIWDRLPMTLVFMALVSIALAEFLALPWAQHTLWPMVLIGVASVCYWYWGELQGAGDLRPYIFVQFFPMIMFVMLLFFTRSAFNINTGYWWLLVMYILAKVTEYFDVGIFNLSHQLISGHSLKHLLSALGAYLLLHYFERRIANINLNKNTLQG